ncbi:acetyl-CoA carboxylase [Spizellomyces sp. 'palustris']|nr:acetyl-CoA carboxylase [Spizellomyces sp. 'palustris']
MSVAQAPPSNGHQYRQIKSKVDTSRPEYTANHAEMSGLVKELRERLKETTGQGRKKVIQRHLERGQLLARDRIELLIDEDSPFLELMPLAGWGQDDMTVGGSTVAGIGLVCGVETLIAANIPTIAGGATNEAGVKKALRLHEIQMENRLPGIWLTQSAGANLGQQSQVFHAGGGNFRNLAIRSKANIPTCCVVFGSSTAGGAYTPGMSDYVIMVKNQAQVFLGGPPLVKMATGEVVDAESLGGAEMHSRKSGLSDQLADDELHAIRMAREWVEGLNWEKAGSLPVTHITGRFEEPVYESEELLGIIQANIRLPFECREVIARIVDGSRFSEFKPLYGNNLVTGFAHIYGIPIGIISNNSVIFPEEANKATQFIQLCNQRSTPILFLQNITGFMVGRLYEEAGIIKAGARFINAVSNSCVPHITINMGASYGAGNYAMCGRAYRPSKCSVMGPEQLTGVMDIIAREAAARANRKVDEEALAARLEVFRSAVAAEQDVYFTSSRLLDDSIIDPRDTRDILGICLSVIYGAEVKGGNLYGVARM